MTTYELRAAIREAHEMNEALPDNVRKVIDEKLFELDRTNGLISSYREVLRDALK